STLLVIAVFVVSLVQKFYRHTFYSGIRRQWSVLRYTFAGGHYRHASIFRSIDFYQAGIAIGMLCLIFMFLSYEKFRLKESILSFMMMASAFLTYTRSNWIIPLIGFAFFINFKPFKKKFGLIVTSIILGVIFYLNLFPQMAESDLYRDRVTVDTYEGRFVSIEVYFRYFWGRNMFLGFGIDSGYSGEFRAYGRPEVHNGYLEVLFRDGFLGVFLYFGFWYFVFKRAVVIFKATGNGLFITFVGIFIFSNFIYKFINMGHFGYLLMLLYMYMWYDIHVKGKLDKAIETADEKTTLKAEG
ncbi:MAG: O-antigen ligase family protein, partial [bacterium]|nr:O-antigen ligase family protein [bacterium]